VLQITMRGTVVFACSLGVLLFGLVLQFRYAYLPKSPNDGTKKVKTHTFLI